MEALLAKPVVAAYAAMGASMLLFVIAGLRGVRP